MNPSANLILIGPTGAGKSSLGRVIAREFGMELFDLDKEIERRVGVTITQIFAQKDEAYFREWETNTLNELCQEQGIVLATGAGAILNPVNQETIATNGYVIYLSLSVEQQLLRTRRDYSRPLLNATTDRQTVLKEMANVRGPLYEKIHDLKFINQNNRSPGYAANQLIQLLNHKWIRAPQ